MLLDIARRVCLFVLEREDIHSYVWMYDKIIWSKSVCEFAKFASYFCCCWVCDYKLQLETNREKREGER